MGDSERDPTTVSPLSEIVWEILLALAGGDQHGYAILLDVEQRTGVALLPGSLYRALHRLEDDRWIEESAGAPAAGADARRRVFRLTELGRRAATAEAHRRADAVAVARRRGLLASAGRRA
jgi:DNA-binding PadR family transcriptional regulator